MIALIIFGIIHLALSVIGVIVMKELHERRMFRQFWFLLIPIIGPVILILGYTAAYLLQKDEESKKDSYKE